MAREKVTGADCVSCGVCCLGPSSQRAFCDVSEEDAKRLPRRFVRLHVLQFSAFDQAAAAIEGRAMPWGAIKQRWQEQPAGPLKGYELKMCAALEGSILNKVRCSVYESRPTTCREAVVPGDRTCLRLRQDYKQAAAGVSRDRD